VIGVGAEPICRRIYTPDYRWPIDRDASPWCPTVRLFRQAANREYADALDCVRSELPARVAAFAAPDG
jgi:hypothetical protein